MPGSTSYTLPSESQTDVATLPCRVRVTFTPLPKSMVTIGTGRTLTQTGSKPALTYSAMSGDENSTVLARRALVQQNCLSSCPIMWKTSTGLPDFLAAAQASANDGCHFTSPGATVGLSMSAFAGGAGAAFATTAFVRSSTTRFVGGGGSL